MRTAKSQRHSLYAKIEIAKKALGLNEDTYRDLLAQRYGKASRTAMTDGELINLVEHFKASGFKPKQATAGRPLAQGSEQKKMRALWLSLWNLGVITDVSEEALAGFARRVTGGKQNGVEALQWLHGDNAFRVIEALKERLARDGGVSWEPTKDARGRIIDNDPRHRIIEAQRRLLRKLGEIPAFASDYLLSDAKADELIRSQGKEIRRALGQENA